MSMVIYILKFRGTNKVYVGQSTQVNIRERVHKLKLRTGTANYKLQEAYELYGEPTLEIICEVYSKEELNLAEAEAFEIYDAINNGFNIAVDPDIHLEGDKNGASKYTNDQIIKVLMCLIDINKYPKYSLIAAETEVSESTVRHIANLEAHSWLEREYPNEYTKLKDIKDTGARRGNSNSAKAKNLNYPDVKSPTGEIYKITNANEFARCHGLDSSTLIKLLNGKAKSTKGWTTI